MVSAVGVVGFASIISDAGSEACCMVGPVFKVTGNWRTQS